MPEDLKRKPRSIWLVQPFLNNKQTTLLTVLLLQK